MRQSSISAIFLATGLLLVSCAESIEQPAQPKLSYLEHRELLTKAATDQLATGVTRSDVENYLSYRMHIATDDIQDISRFDIDQDAYVYIVNIKGGGWYIVSGDYSSTPILSSSENGYFDAEKNTSRHDIIWFKTLKEYMEMNRNAVSNEAEECRSIWTQVKRMSLSREDNFRYEEPDTMEVIIDCIQDTLVNDDYNWLGCPIWHEFAPFNNAVPTDTTGIRCPAGCAVIAIAELLYYTHYFFGYPNDIYASASCNSNYNQLPYSFVFSSPSTTCWNQMNPHWVYISNNDPYTAALCALISKRSNTVYGEDSMGLYGETSTDNIASTLETFLLHGASKEYFLKSSVINEIQHSRPVLCSGEGLSEWGDIYVGHAYLIEGYKWFYVVETEIVTDTSGNILSEETYTIVNDFEWRVATGNPGRRTYADGVYYPYNRRIYIGWE